MRIPLATALALLIPLAARGEGKNRDVGTSAGSFLKLGADARGTAMGQAVAAFAEDASSVYWNPAGLAGLSERSATLSHTILFQSMFEDFVAYAQPVHSALSGAEERYRELRENPYGAVGLGALYLNSGSISEVDNTGAFTGQGYTPHDFAVIAAWGGSITEFLDAGVAGKFVSSTIEETSATGAADVGARLKFRLGPFPMKFAAAGQNIGGSLKYNIQADPLPLTFRAGFSAELMRPWTITAEAVWPRDKGPYAAFGSELRVPIKEAGSAALRIGFNGRNSAQDLQALAGMTAGGGLRFGWVSLDYSWQPFGVLEDVHRFTFSFRF